MSALLATGILVSEVLIMAVMEWRLPLREDPVLGCLIDATALAVIAAVLFSLLVRRSDPHLTPAQVRLATFAVCGSLFFAECLLHRAILFLAGPLPTALITVLDAAMVSALAVLAGRWGLWLARHTLPSAARPTDDLRDSSRGLWLGILAMIFAFGVIIAVEQLTAFQAQRQSVNASELVALAEQQRMWCQRIARLGALAAETADSQIGDHWFRLAHNAMARMRSAGALIDARLNGATPDHFLDGRGLELWADVASARSAFLSEAERIIPRPREGAPLSVATRDVLETAADAAMPLLEAGIGALTRASQANFHRLNRSILVDFALLPLMLAFFALIVAKPYARLVRLQHEGVVDSNRALRRLTMTVEGTNNAVFIHDVHRGITWVNAAWERLTGFSLAEALGKTYGDLLFCPETDLALIDRTIEILKSGKGARVEVCLRNRGGHLFWSDIDLQPLTDPDTQELSFVAVHTDVTERVQLQERLTAILTYAGSGIVVHDDRGIVIEANPEAERVLGLTRDQLIGLPIADRARQFTRPSGEPLPFDEIPVVRVLKTGQPENNVVLGVDRGEGKIVWLHLTARAIENYNGHKRAVISNFSDITSLRAAEAAAKTARDQAQSALASLSAYQSALDCHSLVSILNSERALSFVNDQFCKVSGYTREELLGQTYKLVRSDHHPDSFFADLWQRVYAGETWHGEIQSRAKDDSRYWIDCTIVPLRETDGSVKQFVSIGYDVTDRKNAEADLLIARDHAESASRAKSAFLANMSHEIRTPLNSIMGFANLLSESPALTSEDKRRAEIVVRASRTLLTIVNDILDLSSLEAGKVTLVVKPFDFSRLMTDTMDILRSQATTKGLAFELETSGQPAPAHFGDETRLRQILLNFLSNAIKFTERGAVRLRAEFFDLGDREQAVRIEIRDTGIGISSEKVASLFRRFEQVDSSIARKFGGTGLGLAISKTLVELMGGQVGVDSVPGRGSTFWIALRLPCAAAAISPQRALRVSPALARRALRILCVDDVDMNRDLVVAMLSNTPHCVDVADSGEEALRAVQAHPYDFVLMDVQMAGKDGMATTREIRALGGRFAHLPIVAMTAHVLDTHVKECLAAGMDDHLAKPIARDQLLERLERWTVPRGPSEARSPPVPFATAAEQAPPAIVLLDENRLCELESAFGATKLSESLAQLAHNAAEDLRIIQQAIAAGDLDAARRAAHSMKGMAGNFGAARIAAIAARIEQSALKSEAREEQLSELRDALAATDSLIQQRRAS